MWVIKIPCEGELELVETELDYQLFAKMIGASMIERVKVANHDEWSVALVVDESGRYTDKPVNPRASLLYGYGLRHMEPIIGDALYMGEGFVDDGVDFISLQYPKAMMSDLVNLFAFHGVGS